MISAALAPLSPALEIPSCLLCGSPRLQTQSQLGPKSLHKCRQCGVLFVLPQPSSEVLSNHFRSGGLVQSNNFDSQFQRNRRPVLIRVVKAIRSRKKAGSVLDVGCATGLFLADFSTAPDWKAWGVELTPSAAQQARNSGARVHVGDTRSAKFPDGWFEVVTVLDALYYFPHPASELEEFRRILAPDGILVLELPWARARLWQRTAVLGRLLNGTGVPVLQSSDHLFYFTPKSLTLLLEQCGFRIHAIRPLPANRQPNPLRNFLWSAYSLVSLVLWQLSMGSIFLGPRFLVIAGKAAPEKP